MQKDANLERIRILHLEDNEFDRTLVATMLEDSDLPCRIKVVQTEAEFAAALQEIPYDLIISDYALPSYNGLEALIRAKTSYPHIPFVFFSGTLGEERAIESLKGGAVDYVLKENPNRLVPAVRHALQNAEKQAMLRESEQRNREHVELIDKARDGILVCDLEDRITFWNQGAERIYGWSKAEAVGRNAVQMLFKEQASRIKEVHQGLAERGEWIGEMEHVTKAGKTVIVQTRCTLIMDDQGRPKSRLVLNTDITERKQLEEQFLRAQRLESLGAMVSGIAHDLNNALSPIVIGVDILRGETPSKNTRNILDMISSSATRGTDMVKQMLTFARGGSAKKTLIDVNQLLQEMNKIIRDTFRKSIHCHLDVNSASSPIVGVPTQLHQVIMNLCINARDAMPRGGTITLSASNVHVDAGQASGHSDIHEGNYLLISVADTGTGIPADQIENIFKPFFTTKEEGKGTGLGLSTSATIIKNHGGFMAVQSELGRGSVFQCYLPVAEVGAPQAETGEAGSALPSGHGESILVIDAEEGFLAMMQTTLEHYGYQVLTGGNGPQAAAILDEKRETIRLIISSQSMLFADGRSVIDVLRMMTPQTRIIAIGGQEQSGAKNISQADAVIQKPFSVEDLLTTIHKTLPV